MCIRDREDAGSLQPDQIRKINAYLEDDPSTVSYTHLDVYKRQAHIFYTQDGNNFIKRALEISGKEMPKL